ncbi:exonuclease domain-containing protein [Eubacteriaceae bacterium ES3]|nr:exonuclease domain-containing protein [Eubacteriaceae bacterium ES3]
MSKFAVIDTETTWDDAVMSVGVVVADAKTFDPIDKRYYILTPYKDHGGMYSHALYTTGIVPDLECSRREAMTNLKIFLADYKADSIFAYNAAFDHLHLPELGHLNWYDIMKIAAYRQHNPSIKDHFECCKSGRMKRGYGVENIYRILSEKHQYHELHNALTDAIDELMIMKLLNHKFEKYSVARL